MQMIEQQESVLKRVFLYCNERFPPAAYTILVCLFFWSAMIVYSLDAQRSIAWLGGIGMWLVFFHLRIFDEFKDFYEDRWAYPDRILSKGIVTLSVLGRLGAIAIILEAILAFLIGWQAFWLWIGAVIFSVLMRYEFGLGQWLEKRMLLYAITHNPIVAWLAVFAWGCTEEAWQARNFWYVLFVSIASFAFEIARKTNQPPEEKDGVDSYSSVYGLHRVLWMLRGAIVLSMFCSAAVLFSLQSSIWGWGIWGIAATVSLFLTLPTGNAKKFEASGTLLLLLVMLSIIVAPW